MPMRSKRRKSSSHKTRVSYRLVNKSYNSKSPVRKINRRKSPVRKINRRKSPVRKINRRKSPVRKINSRKSLKRKIDRRKSLKRKSKQTTKTKLKIPTLWKTAPKMTGKWTIYKSDGCCACTKTIKLFNKTSLKYVTIPRSGNEKIVERKTNGYGYVPVIITPKGDFMGGLPEIKKYFNRFKNI
jgi:glutaredoxin